MADTPDVRPVGELPDEIGKTAARELAVNGITSLERVAPARRGSCWRSTTERHGELLVRP
jgi:hypothetical protein